MADDDMKISPNMVPQERRIFCNRTLNLRQVKAIGYDMDYTLVHYRMEVWERRAYQVAQAKLLALGWPVGGLHFEPERVVRGLIIDTQLGNVLKVNSYGYVKQALHGTQPMSRETQKSLYARLPISLSDKRFVFLNTLFSLSEACLYMQLVDLLDGGTLSKGLGYQDLYRRVASSIDEAHLEGQLKDEIVNNPDTFVDVDPDVVLALLDQRYAGKKLILITNSDWRYTQPMMAWVFDRFLPKGMRWRKLFNWVFVSARKPDFFERKNPLFEVVNDAGLLRPAPKVLCADGIYAGGDAQTVERALNLQGDEILYVGDHIYGDVNVSKQVLRWRTALVLRELEADLAAIDDFAAQQKELERLMHKKSAIEANLSSLRLALLRQRHGYAARIVKAQPQPQRPFGAEKATALFNQQAAQCRQQLAHLDMALRPLAEAASHLSNVFWGPLMRAGNDKSHLARQVERYADIYMSRVSNFVYQTPFGYLRSLRGSLPHDPSAGPAAEDQGGARGEPGFGDD